MPTSLDYALMPTNAAGVKTQSTYLPVSESASGEKTGEWSYFDKEGNDHKAFLLPVRDPEYHIHRMKSYNVPEFSRNAVQTTPESLKEVIYNDGATQKVVYKE
jgi:hypothetical protein